MKRFIPVMVTLVFASLMYAQDDMQKKVNSLGSSLGAAVGQERRVSGGGRVRKFEKGAIYWTRKTGARFVGTEALATFERLGGETGDLGYPVSDERATSSGTTQIFEHGFLTTTATGEVQTTILAGATLTENSLTVTTASPVMLSVNLDDGFLVYPEEKNPEAILACSCGNEVKFPDGSSDRLGLCAVKISKDKKSATCTNTSSCTGQCEFESKGAK